MKFTILLGSPRLNGNTAVLCKPFMDELIENGQDVEYITLADKNIHPCKGCYVCQNISDGYGCPQKDDMYPIFDAIRTTDYIILAAPIYTWYCPAEMKLFLDRLYGFNKQYGTAAGNYLEGKRVAILSTHGYDQEYACTPFVMGMRNLCTHAKMSYHGIFSVKDSPDIATMKTPEVIAGARAFADSLCVEE